MQNIHHETATFEIESDIRLITSDIAIDYSIMVILLTNKVERNS